MLVPYQNLAAQAVSFLRGHPRAGSILASLATAGLLGKLVLFFWRCQQVNWKRQARQEKARARTKKMAETVANVTDSRSIIKKSVEDLRQALKSGSLSALEVLHAFQKEALRVTQDTNSVVEPIMEAEALAKALDASPGFKGLLHGIPVSIKENVALKGYDFTAGMAGGIGKDCEEDSVIVKVIKLQGAVPFVRTNIPQTMLSYDCSNPLYGTTCNPQDLSRTPGGSSTGEGALIGGGGSIMGIGGDIGGSLRAPAEFCGIYTLKPTWDRISRKGLMSHTRGNLAVRPVQGPMARDFDSLLLLSKAIMSPPMYELDPTLPDHPFDTMEYEKTTALRIGFYTFDGIFQCQPANVRAVMTAKTALEAAGHEVVHFDFPTIIDGGFQPGRHYIRLVTADKLARLRKLMAYDKMEPRVKMYLRFGQLPVWFCKAAKFIVGLKDRVLPVVFDTAIGFGSMEEYFQCVEGLEEFRDKFLIAWQSLDLDAVICPVFPGPAPTRDIAGLMTPAGTYCWLYNSLNYPSGVVPVTKVTQEDVDKAFDPKVFKPQNVYEKLLLKSAKGSQGLSVGVQCVGLPHREEMCLRVMRDLTQALGKEIKSEL
ncbi:fatty-acid amide hydrolase 1-like [Plakobranchus ocellatus]|uniref:fatty acid amide hydrolase n=1 Tax=Plakobranchus ocellatus TaxID=259542 RepID=A0AAV4AAQ8_9GAST|nr:fatty-acid amide hydrolase 1-like [Plakobranchus ocellatus]